MTTSNPQGPVVIVDPYSSGAFFAPAFTQAGVPVVAVLSSPTPPDVYASSYRPQDFSQILIATEDLSEVVNKLRELRPRCVLPGCESGVELADAIAPQVVEDLANIPEKASARRHKGDMAAAVAQAGLPIIPQLCTNNADEVEKWLYQTGLIGCDLVIKPPKSASTDGVTKVPKGEGWRQIFNEMLGKHNRLGILNDKLLIQEYTQGVEYVIDTISYEGKHSISDICRYHKIDNGPYMAIYDRMEWLPPTIPEYDQIVDYARGVLDAVGMRYGTSHLEVMLTEHGPRLIEIGTRPHGGGHPRFCRIATGDSQVDRAVRYFTRNGSIPDSFQLITHVLVVFLICRVEGIVSNAEIFDQVKELQSHHFSVINIQNNDWLEPTKDLFASLKLGFVVLAHADQSQIMEDYKLIRSLEQQLKLNSPKITIKV
ncbi:ATP-grasp domain-containing protein [Nostoc sp. CENA67]|uniref:ATP-grasp domain-containing protein n=1 Tax=Amazonocrinis nigriterrae CENA67 TaxID=2794033 RepID=A0A8J7L8T5_9NOST|nr:ATP-grasp domain-containing protein [Amazonocrinis nigriterrae]MBH8560706.1 ATP-grasp domain-containing protein [Amazonocrinis nigriterrae CENA67]